MHGLRLKEFTLKICENQTPDHLWTNERLQGITQIYKNAATSLRPKLHLCRTAIMKY